MLHTYGRPCEPVRLPQGVANRDVKLENTLLVSTARPLIKLCDFGYSKVRELHFFLLLVHVFASGAKSPMRMRRRGLLGGGPAKALIFVLQLSCTCAEIVPGAPNFQWHLRAISGRGVLGFRVSIHKTLKPVRSCRTRSFSRRRGPRLARQHIWRRR